MRKAQRVAMGLVMAFDTARRAFHLEAAPGWEIASLELREAIDAARDLGDVGELPSLTWFTSAQTQARCWLESRPDVRRGLSSAVSETMSALAKFTSGTIAEPEVKQWGRG